MKDFKLETLRKHMSYNKETGEFTWIGNQFGITKGIVAGHLSKDGYIKIQIDKRIYLAHRLVWLWNTGSMPKSEIDHIDGNKSNNAFSNLRETTRSQNCKNTKIRSTNSSGCIGVHKVKRSGKYQARISGFNKERIVLGTFDTYEEAVAVRKNAEDKYGYHTNHGRLT